MKDSTAILVCAALVFLVLLSAPEASLASSTGMAKPGKKPSEKLQSPSNQIQDPIGNVLVLSIDDTEADVLTLGEIEFYPAMCWFYENTGALTVWIDNSTGDAIHDLEMAIAVFAPKTEERYLYGRARVETIDSEEHVLEIRLSFDEKVLRLEDDLATQIEIDLKYKLNDTEHEDGFGRRSWIRSRNSFCTSDLEMLAAFVDPKSSQVTQFTRGTLGLYESKEVEDNLERAALIFDALSTYGIQYERDPTSPFVLSQKEAVDTVFLPSETLQYKRGDCDDLSVLYASCLENIGIPTLLLFSADHVFVAFDLFGEPAEEWITEICRLHAGTPLEDLTYSPLA